VRALRPDISPGTGRSNSARTSSRIQSWRAVPTSVNMARHRRQETRLSVTRPDLGKSGFASVSHQPAVRPCRRKLATRTAPGRATSTPGRLKWPRESIAVLKRCYDWRADCACSNNPPQSVKPKHVRAPPDAVDRSKSAYTTPKRSSATLACASRALKRPMSRNTA